MRTNFDFTPYRRSTVGFDRLFDLLETSARANTADNYPPFDIERVGDDAYRITIAVAGFKADEIEMTAQANKLLVFFGSPNNYLPSYPTDNGWGVVQTWPGYYYGGNLTAGNTQMVQKIADAIAWKRKMPTLSQ